MLLRNSLGRDLVNGSESFIEHFLLRQSQPTKVRFDVLANCFIALENNVVALLTYLIIRMFEATFCEFKNQGKLLAVLEVLRMFL